MKNKLFIILLILIGLVNSSCNDWITDTDPIIDQVQDDVLDDPALMDFLIKGVNGHLSEAIDVMYSEADLLSDQMRYEKGVGGTFTSFIDIDNGKLNQSRTGAFNEIQNLRFFAEDLLRRADKIGVDRKDVKFTGAFNAAVAYQLLASYWALTPTELGSPIDGGPMVSQSVLFATAIARYTRAIDYALNDNIKRQINSLIAKCYLYQDDFAQAKTFAQNGLVAGDAAALVLYDNVSDNNEFYDNFGPQRYQGVPNDKIAAAFQADPNEANRIPLIDINGFLAQDKYNLESSPIALVTWQENELMLAELSIRESNNPDALTRINNVRASHSIDPLVAVDLNVLITERERELFLTGTRLIDQRRFNIWHLGDDSDKYFLIPDSERNANINID